MSDIQIDVTTTTNDIGIEYFYPQGPQGPQGVNYWGSITGSLVDQTDLWNSLSAKALTIDLLSLSGDVITIDAFLSLLSGTWNGGFDAFTTVSTNSANWVNAYNTAVTYQGVSGSFATNTLLQSTSALLTPLTTTNILTSQLVLTTDFNTVSSTLVLNSTLNSLSGNWQGAHTWVNTNSANATFKSVSAISLSGIFYGDGSNLTGTSLPGQASINTTVQSNSANWNNVYSNVHTNSASWVGGHEAYTNLVTNSATYLATPVYGTVEQIVATPGTNNSVTLSLPNSIVTPGDLNVTGSLFVGGTAANINSLNISLSDSLIYLGEGNISNVVDIGFVGNFSPAPSAYQHTGLVRVARDNKWTLFSGVSAEPTTVVDFSSGYNIDTLRANIEGTLFGNVSGDISGNAGSVTNGVYINGSYSDPSWITSLADTKITGSSRDNWDSVYTSWNSVSATSVVEFNDTRFSKLSSQAYTLVDATSSIQPTRGGNVASGKYTVVAGGGSKVVVSGGSALTNNLLAYYKLDDNGSGGVSLVDSTGNGYALTNTNNVVLGTGKIQGCGIFNGTNSLGGSFSALTSDYSVSIWVNPNDVTSQQTFFSSAYLNLYFASGGIWLNNWQAVSEISNVGSFSVGTWINFCIIKSGGTVYLYANGSLIAQTNQNIYLDTFVNLGAGYGQWFFNGSIDEVGIWNRALTQTEVNELYNSGSGVSYPFYQLTDNLLAYYKLDNNGSGGVSLVDSTGNGYTLTNNNNVTLGSGKINGDATFDGTNYLASNIPSIGSSPFSYAFWHKETDGQYGLFGPNQWGGLGTTNGGTYSWGIYRDSSYGDINLLWSQNGTGLDNRMQTNLQYADGNWHHYVIVYDGTDAILYVDGSNVYQAAVGFTPYSGTAIPLNIGATNGQSEAEEIDEVGIWTRALSPSEVTELYNSNTGLSYPFGGEVTTLVPANTASGDYSFIAGGSNNNTNNKENTFILGSNITAVSANYTYVNNLSSQGLIAANGGNSNQWNNAYSNSTIYSNNSASYATIGFTDSKYLPISGGEITQDLYIDGNVGIGTTAPVTKLHVVKESNNVNDPVAVIESTGGQVPFTVRAGGIDQGYVKGDTEGFLAFGAQADVVFEAGGFGGTHEVARFTAGGNVGIGTTTPITKLDVNGTITATGGNSDQWNETYTTVQSNSANWNYQGTDLKELSGNWQNTFSTVSSLSSNWILDGGNTKSSNLLIGTNDAFNVNFESNSTVRMTIASSGNIGIGTTTPNANLTVNGTLSVTGQSSFTSIDETQIFPTIQSNTLNLILSSSTFFVVNLNSNITTMNFLNPPVSQRAYSFILQLSADGTARAVTWPISVKWPSGTIPTLTNTVNKIDTFTFITYDSGINYFGFVSGQNS